MTTYDEAGHEILEEMLVVRYGAASLVDLWEGEGLPLDRAKEQAEVLSDINEAYPLALVVDGELREVRLPPDYEFAWGTSEQRAEAERRLAEARSRE